MKKLYMVIALVGASFLSSTAQTTYKDVAPIFYANCTKCHNPIGVGPMPLLNYTETYAYKNLIRTYVNANLMPPWPPDTAYHHFFDERVLTAYAKSEIINWIDSGAVAGDTALAPMAPSYNNDYQLAGKPDLIVKIPTFTSNASSSDAYDCFVVPTGLTQDRFIRAYEIVPGNPAIVHHALISMDTSGTATSDLSGGCYTMPGSDVGIGGYAPGAGPVLFPGKAPLKIGYRLKKGCNIVFQIHYPAGTAGKVDSTQVRIYFYPVGSTGIREIYDKTILQNWKLVIPANTVTPFTATYGVPVAVSLYATFPHNHKVGVNLVNYAYKGIDTIPLIRVNNWNFSWQGYYTYPKLVKVPAGYTIFSSHTYDNTTNNPNNPNNPPQLVVAGTSTSNEMLFDSYQYLYYQPGDDTINITSLLTGDTLLAVKEVTTPTISTKAYPNPFDKQVHIGYTLNAPSNNVSIVIYNMYGAKVKTLMVRQRTTAPGYYESTWDGKGDNGNSLPTGVYIYTISANKLSCSGRLVIAR
jgi:hypothetical protein